MLKNRHLSKAISKQNFYYFRMFLTQQCNKNNIELRIVDKWYPSSKNCNECGELNHELQLSDREWVCKSGGSVIDRDYNAAKNIRDEGIRIVFA